MNSERTDSDSMVEYTENLHRRYRWMDDVLQSIREKNEGRALKIMKERNELPLPDIMENELLQWQYECIQVKALLEQAVRQMGVGELFLNSTGIEFLHRINAAKSKEECRYILLCMVSKYCSMRMLSESRNYSQLVQKIIFLVDADLGQVLTLKHFAQVLNVNRCYLSDRFKKETGTTLTEYVTSRRIARAADLLATSQDSVWQIAEQVGLQDVHYFSRLFKKNTGLTPSQYREVCTGHGQR